MRKLLLVAALAVIANHNAAAAPQAGDWEIVFSDASGHVAVSDQAQVFAVRAQLGYFLDERHEIGGMLGYFWSDSDFGGSNSNVDIGVLYRYNFVDPEDTSWYYAGAMLSDSSFTQSGSRVFYPHVGWKHMLTESVAFDINAGVSIPSESHLEEVLSTQFGFSIIF